MSNRQTSSIIKSVLGFCCVMCVIGQSVIAQNPDVASMTFQINTSKLHQLWFQALTALQKGDQDSRDAALITLTDLNVKKLQMGLHNMSAYSRILIQEAQVVKRQAGAEQAMRVLEAALKLSPELSDVHFAIGKMRFAMNFTDIYRVAKDLWRGMWYKFTDTAALVVYFNNGLTLVVFAGMLACIIFLLFSFIYYHRAIFYQIKEKIPVELPLLVAQIVGWLIILAVTLGLGVAWGLLLLGLLLIWHVDAAARRVLQFVLLSMAIFSALFIIIGITLITADGQYFQALCDISRGEFSSQTATILQRQFTKDPQDQYALFGLAFLAQKENHANEAIQAYSMLPEQFADWNAVQNNLGNLYQTAYRNKKGEQWYQKAEDAYGNAIFRSPKMFEAHFNYAQLLLEKQKSIEAGEQINAVRKLNPERYTLQSGFLQDGIFWVDASFSTFGLLKRLFYHDVFTAGLSVAKQLWSSVSRFDNPLYFALASGLLFFVSLMAGSSKEKPKGVMYCQMCGDPYSVKRSKKSQDVETFCTQCTYIFKKKTAVKPEKRAAKIKQIQLRQNIRGLLAKIFSIGLPGAGQIYFGYPVKGIIVALFFYLGVLYYVIHDLIHLVLVTPTSAGISWGTVGVFGLIGLGSYLFNLYDVFRLSPKNQ
ncbi:putative membrane protein [Candidatus Moduliflexus flocculans]|uniref:Putative membrane protein n=1 Tax=Candidatus Moduliflexus flocculans TaxID=1499966 RepID=A0A081BT31_9BACT|nr:putative membrane protein [Candidatus Moduliflexus flocculans]